MQHRMMSFDWGLSNKSYDQFASSKCHLQLKKCESLPTKKELYATIAGLAKQPATKLATGIKMIPNKLAIAIKKVSGEVYTHLGKRSSWVTIRIVHLFRSLSWMKTRPRL